MKKLLAVILLCLTAGAVYAAAITHRWSNVIIDNLVLPDNSIITPGMFLKRTGASGTNLGLWDNCATNEVPKWNGATWACAADAVNTGSNPVFDNMQSGTNTASIFTLGTGGTLTYSGTGVVNANQFKGIATPTGAEFGYLSGVSSALQTQLGTKEATANKSDNTSLGTSATLYPTQNAVKSYVDGKFTDNTIDGAKIIDNTLALGKIASTGTKDNTTFLRGDGAWSKITPNICNLQKSADQTFTGGAAYANVTWETEDSDTLGAHSTGADNAIITVPAGYTFANYYVATRWAPTNTVSAPKTVRLLKNGTIIAMQAGNPWGIVSWASMIVTGWIPVAAGDNVYVMAATDNTTQIYGDPGSGFSYFRAEFK